MSRIKHWPKDRAGAARHIYDLLPGQERTAILDWIDSLDVSFGFKITEHDGITYLKAHDVTVEVDDTPAVIELLRLWAENEVSPTPRKSLIRIDPEADQDRVRKIQKKIQGLTGDLDAHPAAESPELVQPLTERDREILLYMLEHGHDEKNPITQAELAEAITRGDHKNLCNRLRESGLTQGKRGHGTFLTEKGKQIAQDIKQRQSKTD